MCILRFVCLIVSLSFISAKAQVKLEWEARYHHFEWDVGSSVAVDDSGYVYVTGSSIQEIISYNPDYVTIKYTPTGDTVWIRRWDWNNQFDGGGDILVDSIGNVYVAGHPVVLKYNSSGELLWESEHISEFIRIEMDADGFIYAAGTRLSNYITVKFNPDGQEIWRRTYNGPGNGQDDFRDMALDGKGNIIVTGESWGGNTTNYDFATIKYSSNGDTLWIRRYNGPAQNPPLDGAFGIAVDDSDNVYVTGWSQGVTEKAQCLTLKYSPDGDLLWERRFPKDGLIGKSGYDIKVDKSGYIYVATRTAGLDDTILKYDQDGNLLWIDNYFQDHLFATNLPKLVIDKFDDVYWRLSGGNYRVLKYNSDGKRLWEFDEVNGSAYAIFVDSSPNIYITGESIGNGFDILTIKLSQGTVGISQDGDILPSEFQLFPAYPNPFNSTTNITFTLPHSANVDMRIYNILGEEIATLISDYRSAGTHTVQWDAGDLPSGMYLCRMTAANEQRVIKLLLMK